MSSKSMARPSKSVSERKTDESNPAFELLSFSYGRATNVVSWKDSAFIFCGRIVGPVARVIKEQKLYRPPIVPKPSSIHAFDEENDPWGDLKKDYLHSVSERRKLLSELPDKEVKLFNHLWSNCSKDSQDQIQRISQQSTSPEGVLQFINDVGIIVETETANKSMEVWDNIFIEGNVLSLIRRINSSHLSPDDGSDAEKRYHTVKRYEALKCQIQNLY
jgi:hypothetical protein